VIELNLPAGASITIMPKGNHGEELKITAVPPEVRPVQPAAEAVIRIVKVTKDGTVEWRLGEGAVCFSRAGDTIRIPRYIYPGG
jgi:hypothetical protein